MWVADLSAGWPSQTGAVLRSLGCSGAIGYTGCDYAPKNVSKDRVWDWLDSGLMVGLVIENGPTDMLGGDKAGAYMGQRWLDGAEAVGYDVAHCVGFTSGDFNAVNQSQYAALYDCQSAFAAYVPVHAYYGDQDSGDVIVGGSEALYLWQSDSASFSPGGQSVNARLMQRYNDPRAAGYALDVNDVIRQPLYFMGENVTDPNDPTFLTYLSQIDSNTFGLEGKLDTLNTAASATNGLLASINAALQPGTDPTHPTVRDLLALIAANTGETSTGSAPTAQQNADATVAEIAAKLGATS